MLEVYLAHRLEVTLRNNTGLFRQERRLSPASLRATRLHL